jgi:UDP-N-acetylmuramate--L-alanine ligase/UDP-N-acetylenolpyruvoylglucosamine reductase
MLDGPVHMVGVCGVGMAGVAALLAARGIKVSGCDIATGRLGAWLAERHVVVHTGHSPDHIGPDIRWVVRTPAVPEDAPEIVRARDLGLPVFRRGEVLPRLLAGRRSVAVAGTHGKTTTSTFTALILRAAGLRPAWCIGGENDALGGVAGDDGGAVMVVEADESDGTLAHYAPDVAVVTNIEFDHMEHFAGVEAFEACFRTFAAQARGRVVYCLDNPRAARVCGGLARALSYGFSEQATLRPAGLVANAGGSTFDLLIAGRRRASVCLPVPGVHNVLNALAAVAAAMECGVGAEAACAALARVKLPRRRFDVVASPSDGVRVISDYSHHPSEVRALVATARLQARGRLLAVFQPHRYTRTKALGADFASAFDGVDELILTPVYAAAEAPIAGGTAGDLYACFRNRRDVAAPRVLLADALPQAWDYARKVLRAGDLFLVVGAGDVESIAGWARDEYAHGRPSRPIATPGPDAVRALTARMPGATVRVDEPLGPKTGLRVGGVADVWVEVGSVPDLSALLSWRVETGFPLTILGGGFNVAVSDLGVRGVVARLTGTEFRAMRCDGETVVAGAAVPLARLLDWMQAQNLGGLDFLEGIPGTLGGAIRMNAGAWGRAIGERVAWIRCLSPDGAEVTVRGADLGLAYRNCRALERAVLVAAALAVDRVDAVAGGAARATVARRRAWMNGYASAGSVFENPPGDYAGRLLEAAGFKGARLGGAGIAERHANFMYTERGANGSDVRALMARMLATVAVQSGVVLEPEVKVLV